MGKDAVVESAKELSAHFLAEGKGDGDGVGASWGVMDAARWQAFCDFLFANECIKNREGEVLAKDAVDLELMWTNEFL